MPLKVYQDETARVARIAVSDAGRSEQEDTRQRLAQNGVLHALQILAENAIGKAE
jgi:hypothetical protein